MKLAEFLKNKKETILITIAFVFFPVFLFIKFFIPRFGVKFSCLQALKIIFKYCIIWSSGFLLFFILLALVLLLAGSSTGAAFWLFYFGLIVFFHFLFLIVLAVGIESAILSIKNFRFLALSAILILIDMFVLFPLASFLNLPIG